jgi:hypothetical protein
MMFKNKSVPFCLSAAGQGCKGLKRVASPLSSADVELNFGGKVFSCRVAFGSGRSSSFNENPYVMVWNLIKVSPENFYQESPETVKEGLKEALSVFGYDGSRKQIPNTVVKFNF